ncbi:nuclear receptor coactivator 5 isoform X2 [Ascaphus truei]|uniref:nuclear receptor coactivator 5 isoform X2 n=1 Tax=Ascaphus truei TaxID=8439 RepID=UPI003F59951F
MSRRRSKSPSPSPAQRNRTDSNDPRDLERRIFVGNMPKDDVSRKEMEEIFSKYGKISDINKATERRNMNKAPSRSSPARRDLYAYGDNREVRRDRSPIRSSPRRESRDTRDGRDSRTLRDTRDGRDGREPRAARDARDSRDLRDARDPRDAREARDLRDARDARNPREIREPRDARDPRDFRDPIRDAIRDPRDVPDSRNIRDARDIRDPVFDRYRDVKDARDPRDPMYRRDDLYEKYRDDYRKKEDAYVERYRDTLERHPRDSEDILKREERRREELYRQYFDEIQRRFDSERAVDCSVVVVNKQSKEYAESVGRKVRDLGMMVDLIFLNTEVSLTQALEDVTRGGSPFAIVITQQHQVHRSCTVNILFGTPQEHRNMPLADAMVLVARNYERYKSETRDKEREDIARQAAKMAAEAVLRERAPPVDEGGRGPHPPGIQAVFGLLADNRYVTTEEMDKIILYLRDRKERLLRGPSDPMPSQMSRQPMGSAPVGSMDGQSSLANNPPMQISQPMVSAPQAPQSVSNPQQELQAKILSLFNSGAPPVSNTNLSSSTATSGHAPGQGYGNIANIQPRAGQMNSSTLGPSPQRPQVAVNQHPNSMGQVGGGPPRNTAPRPGPPPQSQGMYGQHQNRPQVPSNLPNQRPTGSSGINFDNPSVQKALDTLIQSGPALSHLVSQTAGQANRQGPPPQSMGPYQRHF